MPLSYPTVTTIPQALAEGFLRTAGWLMAGGPSSSQERIDFIQGRYPNLNAYQAQGLLNRATAAWQAGAATVADQKPKAADIPRGGTIPAGMRYAYDLTHSLNVEYVDEEGIEQTFSTSGQEILYSEKILTIEELRDQAIDLLRDKLNAAENPSPIPAGVSIEDMQIYVNGIVRR